MGRTGSTYVFAAGVLGVSLFAASAAIYSQTAATLLGRVKDSAGAVIAGASVTVINTGTANAQNQG